MSSWVRVMGADTLYVMLFTLWVAGDDIAPFAVYRDRQLMTYDQCDQVTDLLVPHMRKRFLKKYPGIKFEIKVNCVGAGRDA